MGPLAWLDRDFWMNLKFGGRHLGSGTETRDAQSLFKIDENCPSWLISDPSSERTAPLENVSMPKICSPLRVASCGERVWSCRATSRPARWQRGGKRYQRRNRVITCTCLDKLNFAKFDLLKKTQVEESKLNIIEL